MELPIKLKEHKEYKGMYYLVYSDGTLSADFYNLTRANNFLNFETVEGTDLRCRTEKKSTKAKRGSTAILHAVR